MSKRKKKRKKKGKKKGKMPTPQPSGATRYRDALAQAIGVARKLKLFILVENGGRDSEYWIVYDAIGDGRAILNYWPGRRSYCTTDGERGDVWHAIEALGVAADKLKRATASVQ